GNMGVGAFQHFLTGWLMGRMSPKGTVPTELDYRIIFAVQFAILLAALLFYLRTPDAKPHDAA
ncbi:MAG: hypothetical protein ACK4Z4_15765, partial [Ferrovibrio sp.]